MRACTVCIAAAAVLIGAARADEIVFKDETAVRCEIYRETEDYVHYIDPAKDMCCGASKLIIKEVRHEDEPVVDVEAFLKRKAEELAAEEAEELRALVAQRAAAAEKKPEEKPNATDKPKEGKLTFRPMTLGVEVVGDPNSNTPELIVDPFPEEDLKDGAGKSEDERGAKRRARSRPRKRREQPTEEPAPEEDEP